MRLVGFVCGLAIAAASTAALAQSTSPAAGAPAATTAPTPYSTATTEIGVLLDDPAAKAVLLKYIPDVVNNPQIDMGRNMTLRETQQYAPDMLPNDTLAKIDADLAKLPVKK